MKLARKIITGAVLGTMMFVAGQGCQPSENWGHTDKEIAARDAKRYAFMKHELENTHDVYAKLGSTSCTNKDSCVMDGIRFAGEFDGTGYRKEAAAKAILRSEIRHAAGLRGNTNVIGE